MLGNANHPLNLQQVIIWRRVLPSICKKQHLQCAIKQSAIRWGMPVFDVFEFSKLNHQSECEQWTGQYNLNQRQLLLTSEVWWIYLIKYKSLSRIHCLLSDKFLYHFYFLIILLIGKFIRFHLIWVGAKILPRHMFQ